MEWMNRGIIRRRVIMQRDGVCLSFCRYPQGKGQNKAPGYILPWTTWAPSVQFSASSRLCACRCIFYYPRNQVKKGGFFHAVLQKQATTDWPRLGGWTGCPCQNGPSPRLLLLLLAAEERGGSRLAQDSYFGGQIAEAKLLNCPHTLRHI
jgi:hypothetical protein